VSQDNSELLDKYAEEYETIHDIDRLETSYRIRALLEHATGESVLEMGIGFGLVTSALSKQFKHVVAVDGSQKVIQQARKVLGKTDNVTLLHSLFEEYSPDSLFDVIVMFNTLEHVVDPVAILLRAKRWLMPQGKIHIVVPHAYSFHRRLGRAMRLMENETDITETDRKWGHYRVYTFETLRRDIEAAGLVVDLIEGILIKPLSTQQMAGWSPEILDGLYRLGMELPELCSEIYAVVRT
jgi:ubiquinone/menaquinone biosynthesis C-methylase UbiE